MKNFKMGVELKLLKILRLDLYEYAYNVQYSYEYMYEYV